MHAKKRKQLTKADWQVGEASDFLGLTAGEQTEVEIRLQESDDLKLRQESTPAKSKRHQKQSNVLDRFRNTPDYDLANAEMDFTDSLEALMQLRGVSKSELAQKIGTSPAYISRILRGGTNLTLETMVKLVHALGGKLHIRAHAQGDLSVEFGVFRCGGCEHIKRGIRAGLAAGHRGDAGRLGF